MKHRKWQETKEEEERVLKLSITKSFSLLSLDMHQLNLSNTESTLLDLQIKWAIADNDNIVIYLLDNVIARKKEQSTTISSIIANYK
jgi:hypothetical protein